MLPFCPWAKRIARASSILQHPEELVIASWVHGRLRALLSCHLPTRVYECSEHGFSLSALYAQCAAAKNGTGEFRHRAVISPALLLLVTDRGEVIGAMCSHLPAPCSSLQQTGRSDLIFGDEMTFVFRLRGLARARTRVPGGAHGQLAHRPQADAVGCVCGAPEFERVAAIRGAVACDFVALGRGAAQPAPLPTTPRVRWRARSSRR